MMDEQPNLQQFADHLSSFSDDEQAQGTAVPVTPSAPLAAIGEVLDIAGSGSQIKMDVAALHALAEHRDPSVSMAGQVGSQVKMKVGSSWLIANVRTLRADSGAVVANIDFLGEGQTGSGGRMTAFRRGVTRYPIPGSEVYPVNNATWFAPLMATTRS